MSLEIYRSVYRVLLTIQQYNGCIAERNNICYYSCIMGAIITPSLLSQRDNYITMLCCDVIPAARPITNVFYFRCITPPWHTLVFQKLYNLCNNESSNHSKNISFYSFPSPEGCAIPNACNPHVSDYIRAHSTAREREREREFAFFFTTYTFVLLRTLPEIIIEYRLERRYNVEHTVVR